MAARWLGRMRSRWRVRRSTAMVSRRGWKPWLTLLRPICFLTGGAEGLDRPVLARADSAVAGADDVAASAGARDAGRANLSRAGDCRRSSALGWPAGLRISAELSPGRSDRLATSWSSAPLLDRHEEIYLAADGLWTDGPCRERLSTRDHFAGADIPRFPVARGDRARRRRG